MTVPPVGLQAYQKRERHTQLQRSPRTHTPKVPDSPLQRLRRKRDKGCIRHACMHHVVESSIGSSRNGGDLASCCSSTERHVLHMLETQTATQAQAAARAKAAIKRAAQLDHEPLNSAQIEARFKSRAHAVEVAAAKARTHYAPEGPSVEEEEASGQDAAPHAFKKQRTSKSRHNQEYWDCYFHRNACFAKASRPQPVHHTGTDSEEEDEEDQGAFSSWDEGSDFEGGCFDLDSDEEAEEEYAGQQHPQSFYKQPTCLMSVPAAFQQLVDFVKQLPSRVKDDKAAAHLKTFEARKVLNKSDLSSAARRIWLAVHPDKNKAPAAQEVSKALSSLLNSLKVKGVL